MNLLVRQCVQKMGVSLLIGSITWILLLMQGAASLREYAESASHEVRVGPLLLSRIAKQKAEDGFTASFSFESGLLWYLVGLIAIGGVVGLLTWRHTQHKNITDTD